jgi:peptidoglycan biosynthesis protein MviN/MurJ (putative lipid II flippase)
MNERRGIGFVAGQLAFARGLARLPIAGLPLVIVASYGASPSTDCFFLVLAGVQFATNAFAPLLETVIVPFIAEHRAVSRDAALVREIARRSALYSFPISLAIAMAGLAWHLVGWPGSAGWEDGWRHMIVLACVPLLNAIASVFSGYLNAEEWFLWTATAAGVRGAIALGVGLATRSWLGIFGYSVGLAIGELCALAWLIQAGPARRVVSAGAVDGALLRPFWTLYLSIAAGGIANSSKAFVDRFIAASVGTGAVSILEAAERVFLMAVSFLGAPFATVVLSRWAASFPPGAEAQGARLRAAVRSAQGRALALGLLILFAYPAVTVSPVWSKLFGRFAISDVPVVKLVLLFYLSGSIPYLLGLVTTQAILILRDSRFVVTMAVAIGVLNVPLDLLGLGLLGLPGIALASSVLHLVGWTAAESRLLKRAGVGPTRQERMA